MAFSISFTFEISIADVIILKDRPLQCITHLYYFGRNQTASVYMGKYDTERLRCIAEGLDATREETATSVRPEAMPTCEPRESLSSGKSS